MSDQTKKKELLKCLVKDCDNIKKEENKIKEEIEEIKKKKIRMELFKNNNKLKIFNRNKIWTNKIVKKQNIFILKSDEKKKVSNKKGIEKWII